MHRSSTFGGETFAARACTHPRPKRALRGPRRGGAPELAAHAAVPETCGVRCAVPPGLAERAPRPPLGADGLRRLRLAALSRLLLLGASARASRCRCRSRLPRRPAERGEDPRLEAHCLPPAPAVLQRPGERLLSTGRGLLPLPLAGLVRGPSQLSPLLSTLPAAQLEGGIALGSVLCWSGRGARLCAWAVGSSAGRLT